MRAWQRLHIGGGDRAGGGSHSQGADVRVHGGVVELHQGGLGRIGDKAVDARLVPPVHHPLILNRQPGDHGDLPAQAGSGMGGVVDRAAIGVAGTGRVHDGIFGVIADVENVIRAR